MADVLLFHQAQGQTEGFAAIADELRRAGHTVHAPERGVRAANGLTHELVYAGFSLGVLPAQKLAQTRPGARGALLFYSRVPTSEFGTTWPADVPVQIHAMERVLDFLRGR